MTTRKKRFCSYHCAVCDAHFTSLRAFDLHGPRNSEDGGCVWPDEVEELLSERTGECRIGHPPARLKGVTVYELDAGPRAREYFRARERASARAGAS